MPLPREVLHVPQREQAKVCILARHVCEARRETQAVQVRQRLQVEGYLGNQPATAPPTHLDDEWRQGGHSTLM
eukprot:6019044-Pleurochrysis_carterae.AAC.1